MEVGGVALLEAFNDAFNRHDIDAMRAMMTDDCVFENTYPAPGGTGHSGQVSVRAFWEEFFREAPQARIEIEEMFGCPERGAQRWTYRWGAEGAPDGWVRGVDLFDFREGMIAAKRSYVKG